MVFSEVSESIFLAINDVNDAENAATSKYISRNRCYAAELNYRGASL